MIDEDDESINDSMFVVDMGTGTGIADLFTRRHGNGYGINFADGRAEIYCGLRDPRSRSYKAPTVPKTGPLNADWVAPSTFPPCRDGFNRSSARLPPIFT